MRRLGPAGARVVRREGQRVAGPPGDPEAEGGGELEPDRVARVGVGGDLRDGALRGPGVAPGLVETHVRGERRLVDGGEVQLLDRRDDQPDVEAPALRTEVQVEVAERALRVDEDGAREGLTVAVQPPVDGEARPNPPGQPDAGPEGHDVEASVAVAVLGHLERAARRVVEPDAAGAVEGDGPLVAELDGPAHFADAHRPGEGAEVDGLTFEAVAVQPPRDVERVRGPRRARPPARAGSSGPRGSRTPRWRRRRARGRRRPCRTRALPSRGSGSAGP